MSMAPPPRILLVADSDTRYKWAALVAQALGGTARTTTACILRTRMMPTPRQLEETGFSLPWFSATLGELYESGSFMHYDVVVVATVGSAHFRVVAAINKLIRQDGVTSRPLVVTGYVGVVYEKHLEGLLWRIGADVICMNSLHDYELFRGYCDDLDVDPSPLVRSGFVMAMPERQPLRQRDIEHVVFVVQPSVPAKREEREYILRQLMAYSERFPHRRVTVKLRARPGEATTHREPFHYQELYEERRTAYVAMTRARRRLHVTGAHWYGENVRAKEAGQFLRELKDWVMETRHATWDPGEDIDEESGCLHLAMIAWNAITLLEYFRTNTGVDDRWKEE
jgi:hypothetical protein